MRNRGSSQAAVRHELSTTRRCVVAAVLLALIAAAGCAARSDGAGEPLGPDERILAEVRRVIADQEEIVAVDLNVTVNGGVVVLEGVQTDVEAVSEMLGRVARIRGVSEVVNRIRILRGVDG